VGPPPDTFFYHDIWYHWYRNLGPILKSLHHKRVASGRPIFDSRQERDFLSSTCPVQLRDPPNLLSNGYRGPSLEERQPGLEADHSPPPSAEVKNEWSYTSTPPIRLHGLVLN
jgi:hypothetical protein